MSRPVRGKVVNRTVRNLRREDADRLAGEAASRGVTVNALILTVLQGFLDGREAGHGGGVVALELDLARLIAHFGGYDGRVTLAVEAQRLVRWLRAAEKGGVLPGEAGAWLQAREEQADVARWRETVAVVREHDGWCPEHHYQHPELVRAALRAALKGREPVGRRGRTAGPRMDAVPNGTSAAGETDNGGGVEDGC
jgi:hypothetical protein